MRVAGARNQAEAELIQGLLLEEGVPSMLRRSRGFDVPDMLAAGPRDVMVPRRAPAAAREVLLRGRAAHRAPAGARRRAARRGCSLGLCAVVALVALIAWIGTDVLAYGRGPRRRARDPRPPARGAGRVLRGGGDEAPLRGAAPPRRSSGTSRAVNAIAGDYRGVEAVMAYFARRRDHAARTFRMHPGDVLVGEGDRVAVLTDGTATIAGREERWSTVGLYRLRRRPVAGCWLLPLDPAAFDRIWA